MFNSPSCVAEKLVCVFRAEENLEGHNIKDDGEPEAVQTVWLIAYDTDWYQLKKHSFNHSVTNVSKLTETTWKCSGTEVQLEGIYSY